MNALLMCLLAFACLIWASPLAADFVDPFSKELIPLRLASRDGPRDMTVEVALESGLHEYGQGGYYFINMDIGTPPQSAKVLLDTGSSDFWVYGSNFCGKAGGCFDESQSTTANSTDLSPFFGAYGGGYGSSTSHMNGTFITDTVSMGGVTLQGVTLAVIESGTVNVEFAGLLGLSSHYLETNHVRSGIKYPNVVDVMYSGGYIKSHTYSLYLDDIDSGSGTLLFGGYDLAKYMGPLVPFSISSKSSLSVPLQAVWITNVPGATSEAGSYDGSLYATLDSGTPMTASLPNDTYMSIVDHIEGLGYAITDRDAANPRVDCGLRDVEGSIDLTFTDITGSKATNPYFDNTITISVPFSELAVPQVGNNSSIWFCYFGIDNRASGDSTLFGDTFMRSMYMVFALDYNAIALAQSKFSATDSHAMSIGKPSSVRGSSV